jgi:hypothetical protein
MSIITNYGQRRKRERERENEREREEEEEWWIEAIITSSRLSLNHRLWT